MVQLRSKTTALLAGGLILVAVGATFTVAALRGPEANTSSDGALTLHASFDPDFSPGESETVTYTADNAGDAGLFVGTVTPTVIVDGGSGCRAADFTTTPATGGAQIAAGARGAFVASGTISLAKTVRKDACEGAVVTLALSSD